MSVTNDASLLSRLQPASLSMWGQEASAVAGGDSGVDFARVLLGEDAAGSTTNEANATAIGNEASVESAKGSPELREAFNDFVGQTLFGSMLAEMRKGLEGPAYFGGGRAEKVFQGQLDQHLVERISDASAATIADPMYDLFMTSRS